MSEEKKFSRVFLTPKTTDLIASADNSIYIQRDLNAITKIFEDALEKIGADNLNALDKPVEDGKKKHTVVSVTAEEKTYLKTKDKDGNTLAKPEEAKYVGYNVYVNIANFGVKGTSIGFSPRVFNNKLTMGQMVMFAKDENGNSLYEEKEDGTKKLVVLKGKKEIIDTYLVDESEKVREGLEPQLALLEALEEVEKIENLTLHGRTRSASFTPYYVAEKTEEVIDNEDENYPEAQVEYYTNAIEKMTALAEKMYEATSGADANVTVTKKREDGTEYEATAKLRLLVEKKKEPVVLKDKDGNPVLTADGKKQYEKVTDKNGKEKVKMAVVKDENNNTVYEASISLAGTGLVFGVDLSGDEAKLKGVVNTVWAGNVPSGRMMGFKAIEDKASDEIKKYVSAVKDADLFAPFEGREKPDTEIYKLYERVVSVLEEKSAVMLDENGVELKTDNGNTKREEYAIFKYDYNSFEIRSRVEPYNRTIVQVYENKDKEIKTGYVKFLEDKSVLRNELTTDNIDGIIKNDVIKSVIKSEVPPSRGRQANKEQQ